MNFPNNFRKIGFIFLTSTSLTFSPLSFTGAQYQELGLPLMEHIAPPAHYGLQPYYSATTDIHGFLLLSGKNGILRFDGTQWEPLFIPGKTCITINESGDIFVAGNNTFGPIRYQPDGSIEYTDLTKEKNQPGRSLGQVTMMVCLSNDVYILSNTGLHLWNSIEIQYNITPDIPVSIFKNRNRICLVFPKTGLFQYVDGEISLVADIQASGIEKLNNYFPKNDDLYIYTAGTGLQQWHDTEFLPPIKGSSEFFNEYEITDFIMLRDGGYALATRSNGLILSHEASFSNIINENSGLYDDQINYLLKDHSGNLWAVHDLGLTRIEWPSPLTLFHKENGLEGIVNKIIMHGGVIYAATSKGVFYQAQTPGQIPGLTNNIFRPVAGINGPCGQFIQVKDNLYVLSGEGLFYVQGTSAQFALPGKFNTLCQLPEDPKTILAGTSTGLICINLAEGSFRTRKIAEGFKLPVNQISSGHDRIWWSAPQSALFYMSSSGLNEPDAKLVEYDSLNLPGKTTLYKLLSTDREVLFLTSGGLYHYSRQTEKISPCSILSHPALTAPGNKIYNIWKDEENNLWLLLNHLIAGEHRIYKVKQTDSEKVEVSQVFDRRFKNQQVNSMYPLDDKTVWICCNEQLARYDMTSDPGEAKYFTTYINKVIIQKDSTIYYAFPGSVYPDRSDRKLIQIAHARNDISFEFSSNHLSDKGSLLYQYKLKGWGDSWSSWVPNPFKTYDNLPRGTYIFEVRSKDLSGSVSGMVSFTFKISAPLLLSWWTIIIYSIILLAGIYVFQKWRAFVHLKVRYRLEEIVEERTESLIKEKEKTDNLLANLLPKKTADELMASGKATSSKFKMATVLFADIQGFTKIAEQMNPDLLIDELDHFYFQFDSVVEKYNIEKIKTIGDAYMAAGGIPVKNRTNPVEVVLAALEMQHYMKELKKTKTDIWDLRIGIHTGSVIAGVIGQKKFSYDIWGDTVNTASRMESSGEVGKVNISATTYELVKDFFECDYRGKMPVKYKGDIEMYFVKGLKPCFLGENGGTPNKDFQVQLQMLRLLDLEEFVIHKLNDESPESLYFHTAAHASHVYTQVEILGRSEKVANYDLLLLRSAALLHDIGYIDNINNHEERSVEMSREILPLYQYPDEQIDQICDLILATKLKTKPQNLLQKIIYDANLDHIGRVDFLIQSDKLYQEMRALNKVKSKKEWNEMQIQFLKEHDFYTSAAQKLREVTKEQQIQNIKEFS